MKNCNICKVEKPLDDFYKSGKISKRTHKPMYRAECKVCGVDLKRKEKEVKQAYTDKTDNKNTSQLEVRTKGYDTYTKNGIIYATNLDPYKMRDVSNSRNSKRSELDTVSLRTNYAG